MMFCVIIMKADNLSGVFSLYFQKNRLEIMLGKKFVAEEKASSFAQKQMAQDARKEALVATGRELTERGNQILYDQQVVEPVVKKIAAKLKLHKSKLSAKYGQAETRFNQRAFVEENQLRDLQYKLGGTYEQKTRNLFVKVSVRMK